MSHDHDTISRAAVLAIIDDQIENTEVGEMGYRALRDARAAIEALPHGVDAILELDPSTASAIRNARTDHPR